MAVIGGQPQSTSFRRNSVFWTHSTFKDAYTVRFGLQKGNSRLKQINIGNAIRSVLIVAWFDCGSLVFAKSMCFVCKSGVPGH